MVRHEKNENTTYQNLEATSIKNGMQFFKKLKTELPYNLAISLLGEQTTEELKAQKKYLYIYSSIIYNNLKRKQP